ncbi:hypothetical protein AMJ44_10375 [candidate division WOR-1 bacterium DG_54_3]|uniref:Dockerin domain-containing protein n=1 Tax=candidate division WOR-1 bacterium DG_54_3 TaxID=1703775 RepID=A0A0S7XSF9_UNCSA|nr:MAG: hypothetical protein AMJ44_10375 [candidate division WOR-1 bacterium DG_54_3]
MKKVNLGMSFLVAVVFFVVVMVHAQSNKELQPKKVNQKAVSVQSKDKPEPVNIPERSVLKGSHQGYKMVVDVLGELSGEYEWDTQKIPVKSAEQPSAIWISKSDNYILEAGFVHVSYVMLVDATADGIINSADAVYLINYLFKNGPEPDPMEAGDANCDGIINSADVVYLTNYLFKGGPPPGYE